MVDSRGDWNDSPENNCKSHVVVGKEKEALEGNELEVNSDWQGQRFLFIDPVCQSHSLQGVFEPQNQDLNQVRLIHG